eukprot:TRINITY_DN2577_c1_g2_i1.p2 TRINITY_DN2577_c1_g2~~TRINITY_DN2577_c1_g2_i1.p2  ORF type:complete len:104 (+),score=46.73 TRINITY_DN2577_c1_g2_i1:525-836(+)
MHTLRPPCAAGATLPDARIAAYCCSAQRSAVRQRSTHCGSAPRTVAALSAVQQRSAHWCSAQLLVQRSARCSSARHAAAVAALGALLLQRAARRRRRCSSSQQ